MTLLVIALIISIMFNIVQTFSLIAESSYWRGRYEELEALVMDGEELNEEEVES